MARHKPPTITDEQARAIAQATREYTQERRSLSSLPSRVVEPPAILRSFPTLNKADTALVLRYLVGA